MSYQEIMYGGGKTGPSNYDLYVISAGILGGEVLTEAEWMETKAKPFWIPVGGESWTADFEYIPGMATQSGGSLWLARVASQGVEPAEGGEWVKIIDGIDQALFDALLVEAESARDATLAAQTASTAARDASITAKDASEVAEIGAVAAQALAEAARDAAFTNATLYPDIATGRAAVADAAQFTVAEAGATVVVRYRRDTSTTQTELARYPRTAYIAQLEASLLELLPFETTRGDFGGKIILDAGGRQIGLISYSAGVTETIFETTRGDLEYMRLDGTGRAAYSRSPAPIADIFETTRGDVGYLRLDAAGRQVLSQSIALARDVFETTRDDLTFISLDATGRTVYAVSEAAASGGDNSEVTAARGSRNQLNDRLSVALDDFGAVKTPTYGAWALRETRMRTRKLLQGASTQLVIALVGDSYTQKYDRYSGPVTEALWDAFGFAGVGYHSFGWFGGAGGPWVSGGTQPTGSDSGPTHGSPWVQTTYVGAWTCAYKTASTGTPSLATVTSATADNYLRVAVTKAGHDAATLFYSGTGTGIIAVSWDDGATYGANIALPTVGAGFVDLTGIPATVFTMRVKVVSGSVVLGGVDFRSSAAGVRVHRLGASGSQAAEWATAGAIWSTMMQKLAPNALVVAHGTNDQTAARSAATLRANVETIVGKVTSVLPACDVLITTPPENNRTTNPVAIATYAAAQRQSAIANDWGHIDYQHYFGSAADYGAAYAAANPARPWFNADLTHPEPTYPVMADALTRFIQYAA